MPSNVFFHFAFDEFGSECLGEFKALVESQDQSEAVRHFYVWGGVASPPQNDNYWREVYPPWDFLWWGNDQENPYSLEAHGPMDLNLNRGALSKSISEQFSTTAINDKCKKMFSGFPESFLGNEAYLSYVTLNGSLADPAASACFLGFLEGFRQLRNRGVFTLPGCCLAGVGVESGVTGVGDEHLRLLAGQGLYDLENFFQSFQSPRDSLDLRAMPVYLIGESPIGQVSSNRETQAAIAGMGLLGVTRNFIEGQVFTNNLGQVENPLFFEVDTDRNVKQAGGMFLPEKPFGVLGAFGFHCPASISSKIFAARFCADYLNLFQGQKVCSGLQEASTIFLQEANAAGLKEFFHSLESDCAVGFWELLENKTSQNLKTSHAWFDVQKLKELLTPIFENKDWEKLIDWYSNSRLEKLPLEDWSGAIDELAEVIEGGYLPRRLQLVESKSCAILNAMIQMLDKGVEGIFSATGDPRIGFSPHERAVAFVGLIHKHLSTAKEKLAKLDLITPGAVTDLDSLKTSATHERAALDAALQSVPSPAAVIIRLLPIVIAFAGLGLVPIDLGAFDGLLWRITGGAAVGVVAAGFVFWKHVSTVRKNINGHFNKWFEVYKKFLSVDDEQRRDRAFREILDHAENVLKWYVEEGTGAPPLPSHYRIYLQKKRLEKPLGESYDPATGSGETVPSGTALTRYKEIYSRAAEKYSELAGLLTKDIFDSPLLYLLPPFDELEQEYQKIFDRFDGEGADRYRAFLLQAMSENERREEGALSPFSVLKGSEGTIASPAWKRTWILPNGYDLLDPQVRLNSSGYQFFKVIENYLDTLSGDLYKLSSKLVEQCQKEGAPAFGQSKLWTLYNQYDKPSIEVSGGEEDRLVFGAGLGDPAANSCGWENGFGGDSLSVSLRVSCFLSAERVIYYPNSTSPQTPLGRAWLGHADLAQGYPALKPAF